MKEASEKDYFKRLKILFFSPSKFFNSVEKEKNYDKIIFFYIIIASISFIISMVSGFIEVIFRPELLQEELLQKSSVPVRILLLFGEAIFKIVLSFLVPFVIAGITHLGVLIFRGKQKFFNTFKPITYASTIGFVYAIINSIVQIPFIFYLPAIPQNTDPQMLSLLIKNNGLIFSLVISGIIFLISFIHVLTVSVLGISKFQKMGKWRSFFSIIIIPIILFILFILFLMLLISSI